MLTLTGYDLIYLACEAVVYISAALMFEYLQFYLPPFERICGRIPEDELANAEDADVKAEARR